MDEKSHNCNIIVMEISVMEQLMQSSGNTILLVDQYCSVLQLILHILSVHGMVLGIFIIEVQNQWDDIMLYN